MRNNVLVIIAVVLVIICAIIFIAQNVTID